MGRVTHCGERGEQRRRGSSLRSALYAQTRGRSGCRATARKGLTAVRQRFTLRKGLVRALTNT